MHISLDSALGQQRRLNSVGESITQIAPDPAAAYSLRSLTGGDPKVVRVRRASDNHEQDFTASDVSSGALQDFVNAQVVAPLDIQALSATGRDGDFLIAKAAYSLRSLGTRQATLAATGDTVARADGKYVCQVRRDSDDALKSFTATEITDGTLLAFVNADYAKYTSDFSAGDNSWGSFDDVTETGNIDGIGGLDNNLRLAIGSATSDHRAFRSSALPAGQKINFSARVFIPSTNSVVDSLGVRDASGSVIIAAGTTPTQDEWVTVTANNVTVNNAQLRLDIQDGGTNNFAGNGSDVIYLREVVITQVTSDGFVKTWYDQSVTTQAGDTATGNHATQSNGNQQPKIVNAGSLVTDGIQFTASPSTQLEMPSSIISNINSVAAFLVSKTAGFIEGALEISASGKLLRVGNNIFGNLQNQYGSTTAQLASNDGAKHLFSLVTGDTNAESFLDGTLKNTTSLVSGYSASGFIGSLGGVNFFTGGIQEIIIYDSNQTDNRTAIEANIGEVYSIDLPSGVDPGFDQVDGFVETWYDQSGNSNNATQTTAGNQPKIVQAGSLVTETRSGVTTAAIKFTSDSGTPANGTFLQTGSDYFSAGLSAITTCLVVPCQDDDIEQKGILGGESTNNRVSIDHDSAYRFNVPAQRSYTNSGQTVGDVDLYFNVIAGTTANTDDECFRNNTQLANVGGTISSVGASFMNQIGARKGGTASAEATDGNYQEIIIYHSDLRSSGLNIRNNIIGHYSLPQD